MTSLSEQPTTEQPATENELLFAVGGFNKYNLTVVETFNAEYWSKVSYLVLVLQKFK